MAGQLGLSILSSSGALLMVAVVGCGGKTTVDPRSNGPTGGYVGVGGASGIGGSAGGVPSTLTGTRVPAIHRAQALSCVGVHTPPEPNIMYPEYSDCLRHADCTNGVNGKCVVGIGMASAEGHCTYDLCATDADCPSGMVCYCTASTAARCLSLGNCQTDAACAGSGNSYCSPSMGPDCGGYHSVDSFYCHTSSDACSDTSDCSGNDYCNFNVYNGRWECTAINTSCMIG